MATLPKPGPTQPCQKCGRPAPQAGCDSRGLRLPSWCFGCMREFIERMSDSNKRS